MHFSVIILSTDAQDLACFESAHQIGLTVFLHQRWMRFSSHSKSLQERRGVVEARSDLICHYMFTHVRFVCPHTLLCIGNGVLLLLLILMRPDLYFAQFSRAPGCPVNPQWGSGLLKGTISILFSKRQEKASHETNQSWQAPKLHISSQTGTCFYERTWIWTPWHVDTSHCDFISSNCGVLSFICNVILLLFGHYLSELWHVRPSNRLVPQTQV